MSEFGINVRNFGAMGNGITDDTLAFKAVRDILCANSIYRGGTIFIPRGHYIINDEWVFTCYAGGVVHNIAIEGEGEQSTVLEFSGAPDGTDGIRFGTGSHFAVRRLSVQGAKRHGIAAIGSTDGNSFCSYFELSDLRVQGCGAAGVYTAHSFLGTLRNVWSRRNATGFNFAGFHTSMSVTRCCAAENSGAGYAIKNMVYSSFASCASDLNEWGYSLSNMNGVTFMGCGTEYNRREAYLIRASNALSSGVLAEAQDIRAVSLLNCFNFKNATTTGATSFINASALDGRLIQLSVMGCSAFSNSASHVSVSADASAGVIRINEQFNNLEGGFATTGNVIRIGADTSCLVAGVFSPAGATAGKAISRDTVSSSASVSSPHFHAAFYNPNGLVGSISTNGTATAYTTSSDEEWKDFLGEFAPEKAIDIIRRDPVREFHWKPERGGGYAVGWGAQTSYAVSADLAVPGGWFILGEDGASIPCEEGEEGSFYRPWSVDQSKRAPYLWAAVAYLSEKLEEMNEKIATLTDQSK